MEHQDKKIVGHGGLNLSILDGWWCEGYNGKNGFAIGKEDSKLSRDEQDTQDAQSLYDMLEKQVVPEFYERNADGIPKAWIERIRHSIKTLMPVYNTHRMVRDYVEKYYKNCLTERPLYFVAALCSRSIIASPKPSSATASQ